MPKPRKGESKDKFISRCMGHDEMNKKFPKQDQRAAVCYSYWEEDEEQTVKERDDMIKTSNDMRASPSGRFDDTIIIPSGTPVKTITDFAKQDLVKFAAMIDGKTKTFYAIDNSYFKATKPMNEYTIKDLVGGMTFSNFLMLEAMPEARADTIQGYIRSLPQYQEMMKDENVKPQALKLARQMMQEFGEGPLDQNVKDYVLDQFDELSSKHYRGAQMGDWAGEEEYRRRERAEKELERASSEWEREMGTSAETGEELPKRRRMSGARVGMEYTPGKKAQQAKSELASFSQAPADQQADRLAQARTRAAEVGAPRTGSKVAAAREIFKQDFGEKRPSEIIRRMMDEVGMSKPHATTYYYKFKKAAR